MTRNLPSSSLPSSRRIFTGFASALLIATASLGHLSTASTASAGEKATDGKDKKAVVEKKAESRIKFSYLLEAGFSGSTGGPVDNQLFGHAFTDRNLEPLVNEAVLTIERALAPEPGKFDWGFKFQLLGGSDARFLNTLGTFDRLTNDRYTLSIVEAYGNLHLPFPTEGGLDIKLGQFASPMGAEVILASGNFFYSHSYTFNFGIPLQHLGALATLHATKQLDLYAGVVRGTNVSLDDNNDVLSFLGGFALTLLDGKVVLAANTSIGAENDSAYDNLIGANGHRLDSNKDLRYYNEVNLTVKPNDKLAFITDLTYTRDDGSQAECYGAAQYVTYTLNKYVSLGVRGEVFRDDDGFFVAQFAQNDDFVDLERGTPVDVRTVSGGDTTYVGVTGGVNIKPIDHVLIRPELRYDKAIDGHHAYTDSTQSHQFTGAIDVLITF